MRLFGVVGHPVAHSLSPRLHNWALAQAGVPGAYVAWDIAPHDFSSFVAAVRLLPIHGVSVTIPHKEAALALADAATLAAQAVGAANTLFWEEGRLLTDTTDVAGFLTPLHGMPPGRALVLGAGGAARAAVFGLRSHGWEVIITARSLDRATSLAQAFGGHPWPWEERANLAVDLLVNATPLGMRGALESANPWPYPLDPATTIYDLVYTPNPTALLRHAAAHGCRTIPGLPMFVAQAQAQFLRWTGQSFPLAEATSLMAAALTT